MVSFASRRYVNALLDPEYAIQHADPLNYDNYVRGYGRLSLNPYRT